MNQNYLPNEIRLTVERGSREILDCNVTTYSLIPNELERMAKGPEEVKFDNSVYSKTIDEIPKDSDKERNLLYKLKE